MTEPKIIGTETETNKLISSIQRGEKFSDSFMFSEDSFFNNLLNALDIDQSSLEKQNYIFNEETSLYISIYENGSVLISTIGLVSTPRRSDNNQVDAFDAQALTLSLLVQEAKLLCSNSTIYDVNSNTYDQFCIMSIALYHNTIFFFELFGKAYLSLSGVPIKQTHDINLVLAAVHKTMTVQHHNNTLFHALIIPVFEQYASHINALPPGFKEQYIKYDANKMDNTILRFSIIGLAHMEETVKRCIDFITGYYYERDNCYLLKKDYFSIILAAAKTPEEQRQVAEKYAFLLED